MTDNAQYAAWKKFVPYLYDSLVNHHLTWPSLSCRWGPLVEETSDRRRQQLYLSEQTDGSEPNKLIVTVADLPKPRTAAAEGVAHFSEAGKSPCIASKPLKTLLHPGEVNKLRELPQQPSLVVTHTDAPQLYVWDLDAQPDRAGDKGAAAKQASSAELILEGHEDNAEFALAISTTAQPMVASGGKDTLVLLWNLGDYVTSLATPPAADGAAAPAANGGAKLQAQLRLEGHTNTVEDVVFLPGSGEQLASVGDDYALLLWDTRSGTAPVLRAPDAHGAHDVHCVDWSALRSDLLVTGAADGTVKVWDRRNLSVPTFSFQHHSEATMRVEWSPHRAGVFASGGDDKLVCIWDLDSKGSDAGDKKGKTPVPPQLMFQHGGHRASIVDLQWNPSDPWSLMSVSDDVREGGGGTLQLWRVSDLIYRPDDEVLAELEQFRDYIISGNENKLKAPASQQPSQAASLPPSQQPSQAPSQQRGDSAAGAGATSGQQAQQQQQPVAGEVTSGDRTPSREEAGTGAGPTAMATQEEGPQQAQQAQQAQQEEVVPTPMETEQPEAQQ